MRCHALLLLLPATCAFQLPFRLPFFTRNVTDEDFEQPIPTVKVPRIAIIGAGAGGSSAAFWISKAKERFGLSLEVDVYEREPYIGGRSTTVYPYSNTSLPPLEVGASIFVSANKNLWRASDEFNLTRRVFNTGSQTGIWDGEELLFSFGNGWWDTVKAILRFGISAPKRTDQIVQEAVKKFLNLYTAEAPKWNDVAELAASLDFLEMVQNATADYFRKGGVSNKFASEMIEAATRVNYGQNIDDIHAVGGACSMAATGARGIEGGNFQVFEQFMNRSGANVHLKTAVTSISEVSSPSRHWTIKTSLGSIDYKAVILAAPFHSTGIALPSAIASSIPEQPYVHLHVTLLTTTSPTPNPAYFGLQPGSSVPSAVLTTYEGVRNGRKEPEFNSLSYHGLIREGEWAVKIFSKERLSDEWLNNMFLDKVGWVYRKEWDAYPRLTPTSTFPPVKLGSGFYYVNALEPFISTMETETVASRNVVDLLLNEEFGTGLCPTTSAENRTTSNDKEFVIGWDC
ncbi:putative prenylcysteine lyase [Lyophyllum shimeji]|uniref:Prenylcysteine lyase n=1 Tax=Lyophyllum shimeji TaxID=47721 RepID=A0A9P3PJF6_LYOSH|nr:putative prenylcysteine lyase [Lyophyllum shimeji]